MIIMESEIIERITPTRENLQEVLDAHPDSRARYGWVLQFVKDKRVADYGCGVGYGCYLMSKVAKEVFGYDIDSESIAHAKKHFQEVNTHYDHVDNFKGPFDVVVCFDMIEHVNEEEGDRVLQKIRGQIAKGGLLIVGTNINKTENKINTTPFHKREYSDIEFPAKIEKNGFKIFNMNGLGTPYHEAIFGKEGQKLTLFSFIKLGIHRILPRFIREIIKKAILPPPGENMKVTTENWNNLAEQIAVATPVD